MALALGAMPAHAAVTANITSANFPDQIVGTTSNPISITLTNTGSHWTTIQSATVSTGQFSYSGPSLPFTLGHGQSVNISVTFNPSAPQAYSGTLALTISDGSTTAIGLTGTGIQAPAITSQPVSESIVAGQTASFSVAATGTSPMKYQWMKNAAAISGATSSSYTTPAETIADNNAQFNVTLSNSAGSVTSSAATLTVTPATHTVSGSISPATSGAGTTLMLTGAASATATADSSGNYTFTGLANGSYTLTPSKAGFTFSPTNAAANVSNSNVTVATFTAAANAAGQTLFTTQVPSQLGQSDGASVNYELGTLLQSNTAGQITAIRFWKDAKESGTHTGHIWSAAGQLLASATFVNETASGWQQQALATPLVMSANTTYVVSVNTGNSFYVATASGLASKVTNGNLSSVVGNNGVYGNSGAFPTNSWQNSNYFRDVVFMPVVTNLPPTITTQPSSATIAAGQTATFSAAATGTAPMTFQWMKNSTAISGATSSSYTTPAETTTDNNAKFTVKVGNSLGTATSNSATLTVTATTLVLNASASSLSFGNVNVSSSGSQSIALSNAGTSSVTVSNVSISGAGFTASGVPAGLILSAGQTATLTVTFAPAATGSVTGSVTVTSNATNSPAKVTLSGTGVTAVVHSASLSWIASGSTVIGYNCYSSAVSGGPYVKLNSTPITATTYKDSTVQSGKTYYYVVTSVDSNDVESAHSTQVSATIP